MKSDGPRRSVEIREGNQDMGSDLSAGSLAPDRIPAAMSASPTSRAPSTADASMTSDADMAWFLAVAADVCLTGPQRTMTFVELGGRGIPSRDRADPQRGHVGPDDVVVSDIRSAAPLARRVPRQSRRAATAHDACRDSRTAVSAGSNAHSTGEGGRCAAHRGTSVPRSRP